MFTARAGWLSHSCSPCSAGTNGFGDPKYHEKRRAGGGVEMTAKGSNSACELAAVGVIIQLPGSLSELFADNLSASSEDL